MSQQMCMIKVLLICISVLLLAIAPMFNREFHYHWLVTVMTGILLRTRKMLLIQYSSCNTIDRVRGRGGGAKCFLADKNFPAKTLKVIYSKNLHFQKNGNLKEKC